MFRNLLFLGLIFLVFTGSTVKDTTAADPKWEQLFNGKNLNGWHPKIRYHDLDDNFNNTFRVENGLLEVRYDQYDKFNETYGHLFYKKPYSYYLIAVEYRFVGDQCKGGPGWAFRNNGIMIHGQAPETMKKDQDFPNSMEVQLLGGTGKGNRSTANLCTPGTQFERDGKIITQHCTDSKSQTYNGDQWVRVEALVLADSLVIHYVNGEEVMRYEKPQHDPAKGEKEGEFLKSGSISIQAESHPTDFRKIEIIDLEKYAKNPAKLKAVVDKLMSTKRVAAQ
ncbi:3-keto-disaccharide hydrolase [Mucilaginibacter sp. UYCu711]|uniref:3-keto-disaccharide hydrolase n=1 Tax=Mucilaginibacter sp. UYCu711 TaxID=3156339 RepID=UPI003D1F3052